MACRNNKGITSTAQRGSSTPLYIVAVQCLSEVWYLTESRHMHRTSCFHRLRSLLRAVHTRSRAAGPAHLPSLKHLIAQQQVGGYARARRDAVPQNTEGVVHALQLGIHGVACGQVEADNVALGVLVLQFGDWEGWLAY